MKFVYSNFRTNDVDGTLLDFEDLVGVELKGQNLQAFINDWDAVILGLNEEPTEAMMETLFKKQLKKCTQLDNLMALYQQRITQDGYPKSYGRLREMVD